MGLHKAAVNSDGQGHIVAAGVLGAVAVLLELGGTPVRLLLAYDRDALAGGEVWRLLTGHFVHLGWGHVLLNVAGLFLVAWLVGKSFSVLRWSLVVIASLVAMDAGFWLINRDLDWYVGLSGLLHGLLAAGLYKGIRDRDRESVILAVLVLAKLGWEQLSGPLPGSAETAGGAVIVDAHLYGAVGGALAAALLTGRRVRPATSI